MWKYRNQIKLRWVTFGLGLIALILIYFIYFGDEAVTKIGIKALLTRVQTNFEMLPLWSYAVMILTAILILLAGAPSICIIFPLILVKNTTFAFIVVAACQTLASLIAMWIAHNSTNIEISDVLKDKLENNKEDFQGFAFWSRLYYNIPLRTIDWLSPLVHNKSEAFYNSLIAAASSIMIRICIPTLLAKHAIYQFTLLEPNPELAYTKFLIWGTVLIVYTLMPKVPELMPCPDRVKKVILELETPTLPSNRDKLMEEAPKEGKIAEEKSKE